MYRRGDPPEAKLERAPNRRKTFFFDSFRLRSAISGDTAPVEGFSKRAAEPRKNPGDVLKSLCRRAIFQLLFQLQYNKRYNKAVFESKTESTVRRLRERIAAGELGACGDRFMTTRELAAREKLSLKTAFHVIVRLRESGLLEKFGRGHRIAPVLPENGAAHPLLIGFLAACLENPYFAKLAAYAEEFAHSVGASMIIASSSYDFATECERLRMFCRQGVSGILVCPRASTPREEAFYAGLPVPCVMLGRRLESTECDAVLVDNQLAAQRVARHLIKEGITEFAYIGQSGKLNDRRLFGFRAELAAAGLALP